MRENNPIIQVNNFATLIDYISGREYGPILDDVADCFGLTTDDINRVDLGILTACGTTLHADVIRDLKSDIEGLNQLYDMLDADSQFVFERLLIYRLLPDATFLEGTITDGDMLNLDSDKNDAYSFIREHWAEIEEGQTDFSFRVDGNTYDIWVVPKIITNINPSLFFEVKNYNSKDEIITILRCLHKVKNNNPTKKQRKLVTIAFDETQWFNEQLTKDCGLVPFLMHMLYGFDAYMVGTRNGDYPNLKYVPGLKMEFLEDGRPETKLKYMTDNARNIDLLVVYGPYPINAFLIKQYKILNPEGKVYLALDANSGWMDRIPWEAEYFRDILDNADLIGTSCSAMQKLLNQKWPWDIYCITNGYYSFGAKETKTDFAEKENIILTVGRIGTKQKATDVLLNAFALIYREISDWKLVLVGSVEDSFKTFIDEYFEKYPDLKERVIFKGKILDREKLQGEYRKAKIFALTSIYEGGPNVIGEALNAGCTMAVTQFDAFEDIIDFGRCGLSSKIGDVEAFAEILGQLCNSENLRTMSEAAYQNRQNNFDMERNVKFIYEMLYNQ